MPHGGGHISHGHGHGGGGHFGGGHHHHHHHHFGGHRRYGGVVYTGGYYYTRTRWRGAVWGFVGMIIVAVVIVTVSCSVTLSKDEDEEKRFTHGDTRIKSFNTFFCSGIKGSTTYEFESSSAKLYVIDKEPKLSVRNSISFDNSFSLYEDDYQYWHYYLYENSNITLDGCTTRGIGYWVYIIKGTDKWNDWKDYASSSKAVYSTFITASCDKDVAHVSFRVKARGHYYISYYNDQVQLTSGHQILNVSRFEYAVPSPNGLSNCSFAGKNTPESCKVSVPFMSSSNKVLLWLPSIDSVRQEDDFYLDLDCTAQAAGYVIVVLVPLAFVILLIVIAVGIGYYYLKRSKRKEYEPIVQPTTPALNTEPSVPYDSKGAPPPYQA